jgi:transcriptional regulator with XRE-family HTH domain
VEIGNRLRELRDVKSLSQREIEHRTGLPQTYISKVETGHSTPLLPALERWAKALSLELYQLFFVGPGRPQAPVVPERISIGIQERALLRFYRQMAVKDRALLISLARDIVKLKDKTG